MYSVKESTPESELQGLNVTQITSSWKYNYVSLSCWSKKHGAGRGGARLYSQYSGGRGRQISEFKASLVNRMSSRTARATQRKPKKEYLQSSVRQILLSGLERWLNTG